MQISPSELILNPDGSIYHIQLLPEDLATDIITVGDPARVDLIAERLDKIEVKKQKREFYTVTGYVGNHRLSVISTGIGTDNIDIVINECDALVNIDLESRKIKEKLTKLQFIRIGTSGGLQKHLGVDSFVSSTHGIGLEGLLHYYQYEDPSLSTLNELVTRQLQSIIPNVIPYVAKASSPLIHCIPQVFYKGMTLTAGGFYGPQGRSLRLPPAANNLVDQMSIISHEGYQVTNLEMETSAIYALAKMLGHQAISFNAIIANRKLGSFSNHPQKTVEKLIDEVLSLF